MKLLDLLDDFAERHLNLYSIMRDFIIGISVLGTLVLIFVFVMWIFFKCPVFPLTHYSDTINQLNSPEYNAKLKELYEDNGITLYDDTQLSKLESKINNERILQKL